MSLYLFCYNLFSSEEIHLDEVGKCGFQSSRTRVWYGIIIPFEWWLDVVHDHLDIISYYDLDY